MGKHNGKARKRGDGPSVGGALVNKAKREGRTSAANAHLTEGPEAGPTGALQSALEVSDLVEMMNMAELADRDFAGQRGEAVVIMDRGGAAAALDAERANADRSVAEARHRHRLVIPRRPAWTPGTTTAAELDADERASFLAWRRDLAALESDERLVLTPFEKNLEVWRQLWRVVERSDAVVQVLDARDPLTYRSEDLEAYCADALPARRRLLLLNKSDLLPAALRSAWADHFDMLGLRYAFWSAKAAADAQKAAEAEARGEEAAPAPPPPDAGADPRAALLSVPELMALLEAEARAGAAEAAAAGHARASRGQHYVVGLTGYPNVGKSSTINALFGSKKTAVAATPGKTKHFQTLFVGDALCLCDCPGLVMPQFARSKAEMVAAGVIPIDRLTDVRAPVAVVAARVSRAQLEGAYGLRLRRPPAGEPADAPPSAAELLRALAASRGWSGASNLPDETRAGRRLLKDYVDGRILAVRAPPGAPPDVVALADEVCGRAGASGAAAGSAPEAAPPPAPRLAAAPRLGAPPRGGAAAASDGEEYTDSEDEEEEEEEAGPLVLDDADLDLMGGVAPGGAPPGRRAKTVTRAAHKLQKKIPRAKIRTGGSHPGIIEGTYDGAALPVGKRGGLVRVKT
jgi:large subunit GTPase 1